MYCAPLKVISGRLGQRSLCLLNVLINDLFNNIMIIHAFGRVVTLRELYRLSNDHWIRIESQSTSLNYCVFATKSITIGLFKVLGQSMLSLYFACRYFLAFFIFLFFFLMSSQIIIFQASCKPDGTPKAWISTLLKDTAKIQDQLKSEELLRDIL